jgi:hypothetical protein
VILLLAIFAFQDADRLVRDLGDDDPGVRERAGQRLLDMGPPALTPLKSREKDPDPELRERVLALVSEIGRQERLRALRPKPLKLTLSLNDSLVEEAVRAVLSPYGLQSSFAGQISFLKTRKVTLKLKDALFWEAFDALCKEAGITVDFFTCFGICFRDGQGGVQAIPHGDVGEFRITASHVILHRNKNYVIQAVQYAPPTYRALSQRMVDVTFVDDDGRTVQMRPRDHNLEEFHNSERNPGSLMGHLLWEGRLESPPEVTDWSKVELKGIIVRTFPRDLERFAALFPGEGEPAILTAHGMNVTACWRKAPHVGKPPRERWIVTVEWKDAKSEKTYLVWLEDAQGRWLVDGCGIETGKKENMTGKRTIDGLGAGATPPNRMVLVSIEGEEEIRTQFTIKGLGGPPQPDK